METNPTSSQEKELVKLGLYMRCSTDNQELIIQEEALTKKVQRLKEDNPHIYYQTYFYKDKGFSGKSIARPEFQRLIKDVDAKKIDCVLVIKLDRLSRSLQDLLMTATVFEKNGCNFIVVEQSIDTTTPQGRLLFQILGAFAEFEREIIRERMATGRKKAQLTGTKSGNPCHRPTIKVDEDGVVFKFKEGWSMNAIAKAYNISITPIRRILQARGLSKTD